MAKNNQKSRNRNSPAQTKDIRSLTLRELREKLIAFRCSTFKTSMKWVDGNKLAFLRQLANRQNEDGNKSELSQNFSRESRKDYAASLDQYKKQYHSRNLKRICHSSTLKMRTTTTTSLMTSHFKWLEMHKTMKKRISHLNFKKRLYQHQHFEEANEDPP